jgi:hypothetical protein
VTVPTYGTPFVALGGDMAMLDALEMAWNPRKATVPVVILRIIAESHGTQAWTCAMKVLSIGASCSNTASVIGRIRDTYFFISAIEV